MLTVTRSTQSAPSACLASAATVLLSRPPLKATTTGFPSATVWISSTTVRMRPSVSVIAGIGQPLSLQYTRHGGYGEDHAAGADVPRNCPRLCLLPETIRQCVTVIV